MIIRDFLEIPLDLPDAGRFMKETNDIASKCVWHLFAVCRRSEERRVGKECSEPGLSRGWPDN